jgi:rSAM/selenodomain-associated transferase 1
MHFDDCLIIMVKDPETSRVKTRLAARLGGELAAALYRAFVADILNTARPGRYDLRVAFDPPGSAENIRNWLGDDIPLRAQAGDGLGERMKYAFRQAFHEGYTRVALIGSDIPDLTANVLHEAFARLDEDDAVIGPALDNGYYLLGFKQGTFLGEVFDGIDWGTDAVYRQTMRVLGAKGQKVHVLPGLRDIDTLEDLRTLYHRGDGDGLHSSATMACVTANKTKIL